MQETQSQARSVWATEKRTPLLQQRRQGRRHNVWGLWVRWAWCLCAKAPSSHFKIMMIGPQTAPKIQPFYLPVIELCYHYLFLIVMQVKWKLATVPHNQKTKDWVQCADAFRDPDNELVSITSVFYRTCKAVQLLDAAAAFRDLCKPNRPCKENIGPSRKKFKLLGLMLFLTQWRTWMLHSCLSRIVM